MGKPTVFISYRRDDCAGYAGRLEEALERACGAGTVFRDVRDISPGEHFADVLRTQLSCARVVLVLIGPRWAGPVPGGKTRLEDEGDFVRMEVASALASDCKVIPVLLSGTSLPAKDELPEVLRALRQRQTLSLSEPSWDADVDRLVRNLGIPTSRRRNRLLAGSVVALLAVGIGAAFLYTSSPPLPTPPPPDTAAETANELVGTWRAHVRYGWGDEYDESFVFQRFAGEVTGTATFLKYPRGIEELRIEGTNLTFVTHTLQSMNDEERKLTHRYIAEFAGDQLRMRMHTTGGFDSYPPYAFTAQRAMPEQIEATTTGGE